jgi:hypothetical protein
MFPDELLPPSLKTPTGRGDKESIISRWRKSSQHPAKKYGATAPTVGALTSYEPANSSLPTASHG